VCAKILRQLLFVRSASQRHGPESHTLRELDAEVAQTADALYRDKISGTQSGIAKRVVCRNASAQEWSRFRGCEFIGNRGESAGLGNHDLRVPAIGRDTGNDRMQAIHKIAPLAGFAFTILAAEESYSNALPNFPIGNAWANHFDATYDLMSRHSRQSQARKWSFDRCCVGMTYSAGLDAQAHLSRPWLRNW
jgi:hypothetical protein